MPHIHKNDVRRSFGDKLSSMTGHRGESPSDRASRIAGAKSEANAQGDAAQEPKEVFVGAPSRQISNYGTVKGK